MAGRKSKLEIALIAEINTVGIEAADIERHITNAQLAIERATADIEKLEKHLQYRRGMIERLNKVLKGGR